MQKTVESLLPSKQSLKIDNEFTINTEGLSKSELSELAPFINGIKILSEQIIELPK